MIYALPVLTLTMLGFIFWSAAFRLRRDRLREMKNSDRSKVILTPRQRVRAHLDRAFRLPEQKPDWEADLLANLPEGDGKIGEDQSSAPTSAR